MIKPPNIKGTKTNNKDVDRMFSDVYDKINKISNSVNNYEGSFDEWKGTLGNMRVTEKGLQFKDKISWKTLSNSPHTHRAKVEDVSATNIITPGETGTTFFLNSTTEFVSTLPTPEAGLEFTFIVKAAPSGASYTIVTKGGADILIGMVTCATADDLGAYDNNADVITFVNGASIVGDWVRVISDGTSWYYSGACHVAEGITTGTT